MTTSKSQHMCVIFHNRSRFIILLTYQQQLERLEDGRATQKMLILHICQKFEDRGMHTNITYTYLANRKFVNFHVENSHKA